MKHPNARQDPNRSTADRPAPAWLPVLRAGLLGLSILSGLAACDSDQPATPTAEAKKTKPTESAKLVVPAEPATPTVTAPPPPSNASVTAILQAKPQAVDTENKPASALKKRGDKRKSGAEPPRHQATPQHQPEKRPATEPTTEKEKETATPPSANTPAETESKTDIVEAPAPPPNPCEPADDDTVPVIDDTRQLLEEQTCKATLWLDGLFAEHGDIKAAKRTRGFLEITQVYSQFGGYVSRTRLHIEYDLPTMQNRLSAFVGREDDEDFVRGRVENAELRSTFPALGSDNKWLLGLGYSLPSTKNLQTQVRVGVRGLGPPTAFAQGRLRYTLYSDDDDVSYIRTTPFWNTRDGFGITQSFDYSHVLSRKHLLRWYTVGTISERTVGLNWRNSLILYHNLEQRRGLASEVFIRGETDNPEPLYEYGARVLLRHPMFKERLFLEWSTGYSFPRTDPDKPRDGSYNVGLSIELPYGAVDEEYRR